MGPVGCSETSVTNYQFTLCNIADERTSQLYVHHCCVWLRDTSACTHFVSSLASNDGAETFLAPACKYSLPTWKFGKYEKKRYGARSAF